MTTNKHYESAPVYAIWGTSLPIHWYEFLTKLADEQNIALYSLLRKRMLDKGITETDIESMAERNRIPTLSQKHRLIAEHFAEDGLPAWKLPLPKTRRVMTKGRKAVRATTKVVSNRETINAQGVWAKLQPTVMNKLMDQAVLRGMPPQELASKLITNWLKLQPEAPITPATSATSATTPDASTEHGQGD